LSHRSLESMMSACSVEAGEEKEHPMDFALWKAAKPGEPSWESSWGNGRPGWHIECSAMSLKYLSDTLDIHGGGQDLIFPHHENEIVQSESFTGVKPFVKYWLHNGLLQFGQDKMSKSLGNLITIKQALEKYSPDAIRLFVLSSHYRSPLTYSEETLEAAERGADRLRQVASSQGGGEKTGKGVDTEPYRQRFIEAMDDDFNTPQALAALFDLAREINQAGDGGISIDKAQSALVSLAREVLGLKLPKRFKASYVADTSRVISTEEIDVRVKRLIEERANCRKEEKWQRADEIRSKLAELGVTLEDTKAGTDVTYKSVPSEESLENLMKELGIALEDMPKGTVRKRKRG
jgi:cysteinyl-tRNA synthetase